MRFLFVDRITAFDAGQSIETLKNVSATEDVFDDHFPSYPVLPGALVVESFEQAAQLLIALSHDFGRVGRLRGVRQAAFRHFVRPGDQLRVRCARTAGDDTAWTVSASAGVDGRRVASAVLDFAIVVAAEGEAGHAARLREAVRVLHEAPIQGVGGRGA
jgi:3-hydroxyacyl-[acyl-carrier-protein] dehydratase